MSTVRGLKVQQLEAVCQQVLWKEVLGRTFPGSPPHNQEVVESGLRPH